MAKRLAVLAFVACCGGNSSAQTPAPCSAAEFRQFDFWLGTWEATDGQGRDDGTVENLPTPGGCGFLEYRHFANTQTGVALNLYDPARKVWNQLWAAPGNVVRLEGTWDGRALRTVGTIAGAGSAGDKPLQVVWTPQSDGSVKQEFLRRESEDGPWKPWFTTLYRRKS